LVLREEVDAVPLICFFVPWEGADGNELCEAAVLTNLRLNPFDFIATAGKLNIRLAKQFQGEFVMSRNLACNLEIGSAVQIKCTAGTGMFSHELSILLRGKDRFYESMVDAELVSVSDDGYDDDSERPATIEAQVVNVNDESVLVELPRQVVTGGRRVWVPISEVANYGDSLRFRPSVSDA
jgi:hypothetical protein